MGVRNHFFSFLVVLGTDPKLKLLLDKYRTTTELYPQPHPTHLVSKHHYVETM